MNMMTRAKVSTLESLLPRFAPGAVALHNALHRRRHSLALSADSTRPASLRLLADSTPIEREVVCHLRIGEERLTLTTGWRTLNALGAHPARRRSLEHVDAELASLWLESVWQHWLEPLEAALASEIRVEPPVSRSTAPEDLPEADAGNTGRVTGSPGRVTAAMALETLEGSYAFALTLDEMLAIRLRPLFETRFPPRKAEAGAVRFSLGVIAGRQPLTLGEWRSLRPGDVVMLERALADPATAEIDIAGASTRATLTADGLVLRERPQIRPSTAAPAATTTMQRDQESDPMNEPTVDRQHGAASERPAVDNADFDDLPLQLTCELGRLELSLGELRELGEGSVLPLSRRPAQAVDLVINGRQMGQGRLVAIGDDIGVQIERLSLENSPERDEGPERNDRSERMNSLAPTESPEPDDEAARE
ncbi:type III secretion system cytoplasmic ring protein SctQ [Salinicola rhizosphaerae]|uniref:Flagellar motor switch protein FliN-like C-terminal domain-containing protein n=1 Tax=Salinicola rhizosphaerae TaxID=1443141 RepID=A0ABQ3DS47_9GAMM|nr:type III secretion system cytoplasmic ring protein SctQ [Salinicola rhizosphaerae]GHB11866.1 hypothetical protein GCM10009038_06850 [Salinicola rhizosphaerae]